MITKLARRFGQKTPLHSKVLIVGGGDAGICVARLISQTNLLLPHQVRIIEPSNEYYYQSYQTPIGAGILPPGSNHFANSWLIPRQMDKVTARVKSVNPDQKVVECENGETFSYDYLVLGTGLLQDLEAVKGLEEALADPNVPVASNYISRYATKFSKLRESFGGGKALFTAPGTPIKCGGAPQKIMYLSCYGWRKSKVRHQVEYLTGGKSLLASKFYADALAKVARGYGARVSVQHELVEVRGAARLAFFRNAETGEVIEKSFDIMHVSPPSKPLPFIREAGLGDELGYFAVDPQTLVHRKFDSVFALGDCAGLPTTRSAAATLEQSMVLHANLKCALEKRAPSTHYNGYTGCPIFVGGGKIMLCEYGYDSTVLGTFKDDQRKPTYFYYFINMVGIPSLYLPFGPAALKAARLMMLGLRGKIGISGDKKRIE